MVAREDGGDPTSQIADESTGHQSSVATTRRDETYRDVVAKADLVDVRLLSAEFRFKPEYLDKSKPAPKFHYDIEIEGISFNGEDGLGIIFIECEVRASRGRSNLILCRAKYLVAYQNMMGCEEGAARAFLSRVGRFAAYPYFRSLVATLNWNAGADMPALPVLREPIHR